MAVVENRVHIFILASARAKKPGGCAPPGVPKFGSYGRYEEHISRITASKSGKILMNDSQMPQWSCVSCYRTGDNAGSVRVGVRRAGAERTIRRRINWAVTARRTAFGQPGTSVKPCGYWGTARYKPTGLRGVTRRHPTPRAHAASRQCGSERTGRHSPSLRGFPLVQV
jgi:hypothetical protein